jgi:hypothetical protein
MSDGSSRPGTGTSSAVGARMFDSRIYDSFCELQLVMVSVERAWGGSLELSGLRHAVGDVRHHCCAAASFLADHEGGASGYEQIAGSERVIAHEAYLSLIGLGQMLQSGRDDQMPGSLEIEFALDAIEDVLATLEPFVSGADRKLRAVILEGAPLIEPRRAS